VDSGGAQVHEDGQFNLEGFIGDPQFPPAPGERLVAVVALVDATKAAQYDGMNKARPYLFEAEAYSLPKYLRVRGPQEPENRCPVVGTSPIQITCPTSNNSLPVFRVGSSWQYLIGGTLDRALKENEGVFVAYKRLEGPNISAGGTDWILIDKPGIVQPLISAGELTGKWEYLAEGWIGDSAYPATPGELVAVSAVLMDKMEGRNAPNREFRTLESIPTIVSFSPAAYLRLADGEAGQECTGAELDRSGQAQAQPRDTAFVDEFEFQDTELWHKADGWTNGGEFWVGWRADHVEFGESLLTLRLDDRPCSDDEALCSGQPYASGEYRTNDAISYGCVESRLMAAKGSGVVTALFTYTGPSEGNPHDEVDIEILGKDTTKVQLNYFVNGQGDHEEIIDLGFDAAEDFHVYGFEWFPNTIKWYVDGTEVHSVNNANGSLPTTPGKIMISLWPGIGVADWLGEFVFPGAPIYADYDWVKYSPLGCDKTP
jgi:beta-glucanase (GH16 family)